MVDPLAPAPFIVGVGRSGTTLLRLMLDAHPALAIPTETHFVPDLIAAIETSGDREGALRLLAAAETWPNMGLDIAEVGEAFARADPFTPAAALRAVFHLYAGARGKPRWGDKTPTYRARMSEIAAALPEARFIHIIRDGRDVALSYRGLWFGPGDEIGAQARFWTFEIARARAQAASLPYYMELRFEDLVTRPQAELARICGFLDLPYDDAMLTYPGRAKERLSEFVRTFGPQTGAPIPRERFLAIHDRTQNPPDAARIGRWRTELTAVEQGAYEETAGALLRELGYATDARDSL